MMLIQQGPGEVVDWPNGAQRHGVVLSPQQVGAKHHSQVAVGHLVGFTVVRHLNTQRRRLLLVANTLTKEKYMFKTYSGKGVESFIQRLLQCISDNCLTYK